MKSLALNDRNFSLFSLHFVTFVVICCFGSGVACYAQTARPEHSEHPWDKIVPLVTNRYEIGEAFGKLRERDEYRDIFDAPFGIVLVWYVGAKSGDGTICNWGVAKDTVEIYSIALEPILLSKIGYDLSKFEKEETHIEDLVYSNLDMGISFSATKYRLGDGPEQYWVRHIKIMPRKKDIQAKCKGNINTEK